MSSCVACTAPATSLSGSSQCYILPPTPAPTSETLAPTSAPTSIPTAAPSFPTGGQTQPIAVIYVTQIIAGITASGANTVSFQNAFIVAVTNIFSLPVSAISGYTVLSLRRRTLLASGVTISYTLTASNTNPNTVASKLVASTSTVETQLSTTYPGLVLVTPAVTVATPTMAPTVAPSVFISSTLTTVSVVQTFTSLTVATASTATFQSTFVQIVATQDGTTNALISIKAILPNRRKLLADMIIGYTVAAYNTNPTLLTATIKR